MKINYVLSHPIQYQSPLIRYLVKKGIKLNVFYRSNISLKSFKDKEFNKKIKWDINLLKGYKKKFLNYIGPNKVSSTYPLTIEYKIIFKDCDYIWLHGIKNWYNLFIIILNIFYKKKIIIRDEVHFKSKYRSNFNILFNKIFYFLINQFIYKYLAIGKLNKDYYIKNGINKKKIILIPYVVDNNFFYKKSNKTNKKIFFLSASKLIKKKGIDILLKAIFICNQKKKFKENTFFKIIGDGPEKNKLLTLKKQFRLNNVLFCNFKNQKDLRNEYNNSDVFILPSYYEPWGLTVNEAMASKNLIITSDSVGSVADLVRKNYNGYIFKSQNFLSLSKILYKVFNNKKKIHIMKNNSFKIISKWNFELCYHGFKKNINKLSI